MMSAIMQIPQELQAHFPHPALIIVADHSHAQFWLAHNDNMEDMEVVEAPKDEYSDKEGRAIGQEISNDHNEHHYIHALVDRIEDFVNEDAAEFIHLAMPADIAHAIIDHSSEAVQSKILMQVHGSFVKEDPLEIVKRLYSQKPVI